MMKNKSYLNILLILLYSLTTYQICNFANNEIYSKINVKKIKINSDKILSLIEDSKEEDIEYLKKLEKYSIVNGKITETKTFNNKESSAIGENGLSGFLHSIGADYDQIKKITNSLGKYNSNLKIGQLLDVTYDSYSGYQKISTNNDIHPQRYIFIKKSFIKNLDIRLNNIEKSALITQDSNGNIKTHISDIKSHRVVKTIKTKITNSLYYDAMKNGVTPIVINKILEQYSYSVDFQRDIQQGDEFEVIFEEYFDDQGRKVKDGKLLYSGLKVRKKWEKLYRYKDDFFDENGRSTKKSLLKTPVDGARISSKFSGARRHPVLGFTRAHKGVDFAAPTGTPIYAAGDGVVMFAGWGGGYGNFVSIKHNKEFGTNYAHMSRFAKGVKIGTKVRQRQVIGYIGTTGLSTGPHLHFELVQNGVKINPQVHTIKSDIILSGAQLTEFKGFLREMQNLIAKS